MTTPTQPASPSLREKYLETLRDLRRDDCWMEYEEAALDWAIESLSPPVVEGMPVASDSISARLTNAAAEGKCSVEIFHLMIAAAEHIAGVNQQLDNAIETILHLQEAAAPAQQAVTKIVEAARDYMDSQWLAVRMGCMEARRPDGHVGIAVADDDFARTWQKAASELQAKKDRLDAAIAALQPPTPKAEQEAKS